MKPFTDSPVYTDEAKHGKDAIPDVFKRDPNVFCVIARSNNGNIVTFVGKPPEKKGDKIGVDQFWLDLDPDRVRHARESGKNHDRVEMLIIDGQAYGFSTQIAGNDTVLYMQQVRRPVIIRPGKSGGYNAFVKINGQMSLLKYIWVSVTPQMGIIPIVNYIDIVGFDIRTKQKISERVHKY